jgi:hypothetical protein
MRVVDRHPLETRLDEPQRVSRRYGDEENRCCLPALEQLQTVCTETLYQDRNFNCALKTTKLSIRQNDEPPHRSVHCMKKCDQGPGGLQQLRLLRASLRTVGLARPDRSWSGSRIQINEAMSALTTHRMLGYYNGRATHPTLRQMR